MLKRFTLLTLFLLTIGLVVQAQDDMAEATTFTVTVENISGLGLYANSGVQAVPTGGTEAGPALPDSGYSFQINAEAGDYLSFVTMLAQSNDLFFAPDEAGIALFDDMGAPVSGDVTDQVFLWDAGTEVNQAIGEGDEQAPRQAAPNTGADEMGVVTLASNLDDGLAVPSTAEIISVTIEAGEDGVFTVTLSNISGESAFASPITPVVWVVHHDDMMMMDDDDAMEDDMDMMAVHGVFFTTGEADYGRGLEAVAEDGNPAPLASVYTSGGFETPITPIVWAVHDNMMEAGIFFTVGEPDRGDGLEAVAEDGNPASLGEFVGMYPASGVSPIPSGSDEAGPALPGTSYSFTFEAVEGESLSFVTMFVQSNDLFFAPSEAGIALFDDMGSPISGDVTHYVELWDAGTEVNETPGEGANQAPRQAGANTGEDEMGTVVLVSENGDGFIYPSVASIIRVTFHVDDMMMGDE